MAGITLEQAEAQLALYLAAEAAVLTKQSYTIGGRQLTLANLAEIQKGIELWNARASTLGSAAEGRGRLRTIIPAN
jgi:HJR/Mrr/RecB family endonuclease